MSLFKIEDKVWIPRLEAVVHFEIFSKAISFLILSKATADQEKAVCEFLEGRDILITFCFVLFCFHAKAFFLISFETKTVASQYTTCNMTSYLFVSLSEWTSGDKTSSSCDTHS